MPTFPNPGFVWPKSPVPVPKPLAVLVWVGPNNPLDCDAAVFPNNPWMRRWQHYSFNQDYFSSCILVPLWKLWNFVKLVKHVLSLRHEHLVLGLKIILKSLFTHNWLNGDSFWQQDGSSETLKWTSTVLVRKETHHGVGIGLTHRVIAEGEACTLCGSGLTKWLKQAAALLGGLTKQAACGCAEATSSCCWMNTRHVA